MNRMLLACVALLMSTTPVLAQPGVLKHEFIYESAPFPECHASTIAETAQGTLITAWFGGTYEKHPDVGIWVSRYENKAWSKPVEVANGVQNDQLRYPTWNPVLFQLKDGPLALFFKVGPSPDNWWGEVVYSTDDGRTWHDRQKLPNQGIGPVKNKPIQLADGTLFCPSSDETGGPWTVHVELSKDAGKTWTKIGPLNDGKKVRAIQPTVIELGGDKLGMLCRDGHADGKILQTWSSDAGKTWSPLEESVLPNPNSGIDAVTLKNGKHLLIYNHTIRSGPSPKGREHLGVAVSEDAKSWKAALTLEQSKGEYSYPAVIQSRDGLVHILYTWNRKKLRHVVVDPAKLELIEMKDNRWPEAIGDLPAAS